MQTHETRQISTHQKAPGFHVLRIMMVLYGSHRGPWTLPSEWAENLLPLKVTLAKGSECLRLLARCRRQRNMAGNADRRSKMCLADQSPSKYGQSVIWNGTIKHKWCPGFLLKCQQINQLVGGPYIPKRSLKAVIQGMIPALSTTGALWYTCLKPSPCLPDHHSSGSKRTSVPGTDAHLTSRGNLNISCSPFLSCLLAVSPLCPHLCLSVWHSLCPVILLSLLHQYLCIFVDLGRSGVFSALCKVLESIPKHGLTWEYGCMWVLINLNYW